MSSSNGLKTRDDREQLLRRSGLSRGEVAKQAGVAASTVGVWLRTGKVTKAYSDLIVGTLRRNDPTYGLQSVPGADDIERMVNERVDAIVGTAVAKAVQRERERHAEEPWEDEPDPAPTPRQRTYLLWLSLRVATYVSTATTRRQWDRYRAILLNAALRPEERGGLGLPELTRNAGQMQNELEDMLRELRDAVEDL